MSARGTARILFPDQCQLLPQLYNTVSCERTNACVGRQCASNAPLPHISRDVYSPVPESCLAPGYRGFMFMVSTEMVSAAVFGKITVTSQQR